MKMLKYHQLAHILEHDFAYAIRAAKYTAAKRWQQGRRWCSKK